MATITIYDKASRGLNIKPDSLNITGSGSDPILEDYAYLGSNRWIYYYTVQGEEDYDRATVQTYESGNEIYLTRLIYFKNEEVVFKIEDIYSTQSNFLDGYKVLLSGNDVINGNKFNDRILGFAGNDILRGNAGDDLMMGGSGYDRLEGGYGLDYAVFSGYVNEYSIQEIANNEIRIVDNYSYRDGVDVLNSIERLRFTDKGVALDVDGAASAGGIYRLYKATFNRTPDLEGLGYWIDRADNGRSAVSMAEDFVWSGEFQNLYGVKTQDQYLTGSDIEALVTGFYYNVLDREPDQEGLNFYVGIISNQERTVGRVLAEISDSPENYAATIGLIQNGIQYDVWLG